MTWPAIDKIVETIDWSWYNNQGPDHDYLPYDVDEFVDKNPNVHVIILRTNWPRGGKDAHFQYYFDGFTRRDKKVLIYFWSSPHLTMEQNKENWKRALDGRKVKGAVKDVELTWNLGKTALTVHETRALDAADEFFGYEVDTYSRAGFIDASLEFGSWLGSRKIIVAHYPLFFPCGNTWRQAYNHAEVNSLLPIDNNFTPYLGHNLQKDKVVGWQFSCKGKLSGTTSGTDLDYLTREYVMSKFPNEIQQPADKLPIELILPKDKIDLTVTEK